MGSFFSSPEFQALIVLCLFVYAAPWIIVFVVSSSWKKNNLSKSMGLIILKFFFLWSWFILGGVAAGVIFADIYRDHFNENIALPSLVIFTLVGAFLAYKATIKRGSSN